MEEQEEKVYENSAPLCIIIAWLTKNIGVIIGMLLFILAAILYIAAQ